MAAHQAPPSLGFSRQEHWSGLPFPSPNVTLVQFYYVPQLELPYLQNGHNKKTDPMRIMEITHNTPRRGSGTQQHFNISCYNGDSMVPCGHLCLRLGLQHVSLSQRAGTITSAQVRCYKVYQELLM